LTGLPEYRNGGLFVDCGVIVPRDGRNAGRRWKPGDEFVIEWRALTVTLLDELAVLVANAWARARPSCRWPAFWKAQLGGRAPDRSREARRRRTAVHHRQRRYDLLNDERTTNEGGRRWPAPCITSPTR